MLSEKKCCGPLTQSCGLRVCVRTEDELALYSVPFNFICNMTAFSKNVLAF